VKFRICALGALLLPAAAVAGPTTDHGGRAVLTEISADGCAYSTYTIEVGETTSHEPGIGWTTAQTASVFSITNDVCTGMLAFWSTSTEDLAFAGDLDAASASFTLHLANPYTGQSRDIDVALEWTGSGDVGRGGLLSIVQSQGLMTQVHVRASTREATVAATFDGFPADAVYAVLTEEVTTSAIH
jgi:hypothetical protein